MAERKLFKTKLCFLYQRGRCARQYCNFAHGDAELRRSFDGKREHRGRDLRERLDSMRSPLRNSPGRRDSKARHSSHGDSPHSLGKRIGRSTGKRKHLNGHSDYSGRMSDDTEDHVKDRRTMYSDAQKHLDEQLREILSEINVLEGDKKKLEIYMEDKVKEADSLTLKIHELEMQLSKEKEEGKRFTSKIKEFIKAHKRNLRLQDELKRSHFKLQKLGEQLDLDPAGTGNEDDSKIYTLNDDITGGFVPQSNDGQMNNTQHRTRAQVFQETHDASIQVGGRAYNGRSRVERLPRASGNHGQLSNSKKPETDDDDWPSDPATAEKHKASETGLTLPSTGIAAHAIDEDVEVVETDDRSQVAAAASTGVPLRTQRLPFLPPPPPISQNSYAQYKCDDEIVDIDGVDEEATEVDIG